MSRYRVNPVNPFEPLSKRVHSTKPQHNAGVITINEPYEPFLWLVCGNSERQVTLYNNAEEEIWNIPTGSCPNKVHKVHHSRLNRSLLAVLSVYLVLMWYTRVHGVHTPGDSE